MKIVIETKDPFDPPGPPPFFFSQNPIYTSKKRITASGYPRDRRLKKNPQFSAFDIRCLVSDSIGGGGLANH